MEWETVKDVVLVAVVPLCAYFYYRYMKIRDNGVTWNELVDTFSDPQFWEHVDDVKEAIDK